MVQPELRDQPVCGPDRILAVAGNPLIDGDGREADGVPGRQEPGEDHQERGAVLAAAQGDEHMVARARSGAGTGSCPQRAPRYPQ